MEEKKKRGSNYTVAEKDILLALVKKYQIIENKGTNANLIFKKQKAWESVCQQYNSVAISGFRTWKQLKHLYENLKHRSKIVKDNRLQFYEKSKDINDVKTKIWVEKKEIHRTGGGSRSTISDHDALAIVEPQIQILSNPNDDAALNFEQVKPNKSNIKEQHLKAKLRNVKLENKYLINKNKMEINKYKIEMKILKLRLSMLQKFKNRKLLSTYK